MKIFKLADFRILLHLDLGESWKDSGVPTLGGAVQLDASWTTKAEETDWPLSSGGQINSTWVESWSD
jgi:hypothetical protein